VVFSFVERVFCGLNVEKKIVVIEKVEDGGFFGGSVVSCGMFDLYFIIKDFFVDKVHRDGGCVCMEFVLLFDERCSCGVVEFCLDSTRKEGAWEIVVVVGGDHRFGEDVFYSFWNNYPMDHAREACAFFVVGGGLSIVVRCNF